MAKFSCPARFIAIIRQFRDGMLAQGILRAVSCNEWSQARLCTVTNTVQYDVLRYAQILYRTVMMAFLSDITDGNVFNLRMLQVKSKVQTEGVDELIYADDMAKGKCKKPWIEFHKPVTIMISKSAQKRLR